MTAIPLAHSQVAVQKDVPYLGDNRSGAMDIYSPPGSFARPLPAVLLIHGGGWIGGDKADRRGQSISTDLSKAGFKVFAINYQLALKEEGLTGAWPTNFFDCKSALRFLHKNAQFFGIDPNRIAVIGESAGGHLALLVGSTAHVAALNRGGLYTEQSNEIACIIDMYGIPDLNDRSMNYIKGPFRGSTERQTEENMRTASPINYLDANTPPILILHGTADTTVPIEASQNLARKLDRLGIPHQYVEIPGAPHSFDLHPKEMDLRPTVIAFLNKYLGQPATRD